MTSTLDLETLFLEVFKHILELPNYKYSAFCQRISQLHKIVTYDPNMWNTYVLTDLIISMHPYEMNLSTRGVNNFKASLWDELVYL